jgi:hypothetical protein
MEEAGERWKFLARCPQAEQVYLVKERIGGESQWLPMELAGDCQWQVVSDLAPGHYRFRYFVVEGRTFFNCGNADLTAFRVAGHDPQVRVESTESQRVAWSA